MNAAILEAEAEQAAAKVIDDEKISVLPICPFAIAEHKGLTVATRDSAKPGVSGFLIRVGNEFGIFYNSHIRNEGFKRFSVAHELGHYFLPGHPEALFPEGDGLHESRSGFISGNPFERQADFFAAALLMPEKLFLAAIQEAGCGFQAIERLQEICGTSISATAIRYAKFAEDPVAVVVSKGSHVDYCFMSEVLSSVPGVHRIAKGTPLPPRSCTATFNRKTENISRAERKGAWASLDDWFEDAPQIEMKEDVVGLGSYGKTLTVLFTEEAIATEDEIDG